jgi:hypoxanthine-DNA glycosylase
VRVKKKFEQNRNLMNSKEETNLPIYSFGPIADTQSKVLILGTIPGKESLRMNAYYAHPQNVFWKILFNIYDLPLSTDYQVRKELLYQNKIALWDVLKSCSRKSSLDNDIRLEEPNDLHKFLKCHDTISEIFFNGKGAAKFFMKYFPNILIPNQVLPSTSPALAKKWDDKLAAWKILKTV